MRSLRNLYTTPKHQRPGVIVTLNLSLGAKNNPLYGNLF